MPNQVRRVFVEKKDQFNVEAENLYRDLTKNLGIEALDKVRVAYAYDIMGLTNDEYRQVCKIIFKPSYSDIIHHENLPIDDGDRILASQFIEGQYDQRADATAKTIQSITLGALPQVRCVKVMVLKGVLSDADYELIKSYIINPVESIWTSMEKAKTLVKDTDSPHEVAVVDGFIKASSQELEDLIERLGFAMDMDDILLCQQYFRDDEKRNPTITEMRMIDTYWSDHCRHTTFLTSLTNVDFEDGFANRVVKKAYEDYKESRRFVYGDKDRDICLMDIATIAMKEMRKRGKLKDLDESEEINACSIVVTANIDGQDQEWLVMFKNETHNHPTEIEPFGGAATCLGGAIRDPLSGRSYVYQAMRITGSGDPRADVRETIEGKLPQLKITNTAAAGYSSYGNQIGLATGQVAEIYDPDYIAKRMELGAVVAAAPRENVVRDIPQPGDLVILVGGRTGRDGCGGATGSSKGHTEESMETSGAEVQKGNPAEERKIQRLFRNPQVSTMIKRCNDFGAGGVSVAIGELADGLTVNLDAVPQKYKGLDGTEIAISESQERMAVVVDKENEESFIAAAKKENLEATTVAVVTQEARLKMHWRGNTIVDISREFLDTNGAPKSNDVKVLSPDEEDNFFTKSSEAWEKDAQTKGNVKDIWFSMLEDLNICSQKGLVQRFDSTIGAGTVLMPLGGKYQLTPAEGMVAKLPVFKGDTTTGTIMAFGYNPNIAKWSPFHGGVYAIVEAIAKITAIGGDFRRVRLSLQEYFERLEKDAKKWGKPFSALLGALMVQTKLEIPAIGGKDSMSGTFNDLSVPPTLVAFGVTTLDVRNVISPEFKKRGSQVVLIPLARDKWDLPNFDELKTNYTRVHDLINDKKILSAHSVRSGGVAEAISKMAFGNKIGFRFGDGVKWESLFSPDYGSIVLEIDEGQDIKELFREISYIELGMTIEQATIEIEGHSLDLEEAVRRWEEPLEEVFPSRASSKAQSGPKYHYKEGIKIKPRIKVAKPRVFIPIFPGTASEYDLIKAFERAGGLVESLVFRNLRPGEIEESIERIAQEIERSQIVVIPEGISIGEEVERTGQFPAAILRNPRVFDAIMEHLKERDGLVLGLGGGFEALLKLGLISSYDIDLTLNPTGFHISSIGEVEITSNLSPWFSEAEVGDNYTVAVSQRQGQLVADPKDIEAMGKSGQIATRFADLNDGSIYGIEGLTSPDGRILGRLGRPERLDSHVAVNIPSKKTYNIFESGVAYYR